VSRISRSPSPSCGKIYKTRISLVAPKLREAIIRLAGMVPYIEARPCGTVFYDSDAELVP